MQHRISNERGAGTKLASLLRAGIVLVAFCAVLLAAGCATESRHRWLSFFFDGVPTPGATNAVSAGSEDEQLMPIVEGTNLSPALPIVAHTLHPPFHDQQCTECHESKFSQKMKGPMNSVCFSCHDDFLAKAKVKHQPVESGDCKSCHDPHESVNKKLLVRTGNAMCLECHDNPIANGKVKHQAVESNNCTECHNPHASNVKALLNKPVAASCFECHDDFLKTAKVKHSPAENGECLSCHAAHESDHKGLLRKPDPQICFECHEEADIAKVDAHKNRQSTACLTCHNPHGGSSKLLRMTAESKPADETVTKQSGNPK